MDVLKDGQPCVIATVVRTKGSTPQKAGAMLLVRDDGSGLGTLGGGCVEGDIWFAAKEILRRNGGPEFKDYYLNEDIAARDGLVCGGTMYFYLEPFRNGDEFLPIGEEIIDAYEGGDPVGLATLVNAPEIASGSGPKPGAKLLLRSDGSVAGTLGTTELDAKAIEAASRVAEIGNSESITTSEGAEIFVEGFTTPPTLVMVGGGHVGKATADLANFLGYRVYVVDDRAEFSNKGALPLRGWNGRRPLRPVGQPPHAQRQQLYCCGHPGPPVRRHGLGVRAYEPGPLHRPPGQPPEDSDDLPAPDGAGEYPKTGSKRSTLRSG